MAHTPMSLIVVLASRYTTKELCAFAAECDAVDACKYLDALALHAKRSSWGDLIEQSILDSLGKDSK